MPEQEEQLRPEITKELAVLIQVKEALETAIIKIGSQASRIAELEAENAKLRKEAILECSEWLYRRAGDAYLQGNDLHEWSCDNLSRDILKLIEVPLPDSIRRHADRTPSQTND